MSDFLEAENEEQALEQLHEMDCTDGLPVVIPTSDRVANFVLASGLDGDDAFAKFSSILTKFSLIASPKPV